MVGLECRLRGRVRCWERRGTAIVLTLIVSGWLSSCTVNLAIQSPQKTYNQGVEALGAGDYDQALAKLSQVIVKTPEFAEAYVNRGVAYQGLGEVQKAIADYDEAIAIDAQLFDAYFNRGNSQAHLEAWSLAKADFDQAIELQPDSGAAYGNRAMMHHELGDSAQAEVDLEQAIALFKAQGNPTAQAQAEQQLRDLQGS